MDDIASIEAQIREEDVAALDAYERGTGEAPILYRAGFLKDADGPQVFVANEETEDRMGDVIAVDGWQLANFRRNPVLMFVHDYRIAPVGTVPRIWTEEKQLLNTVRFDEEDEFAKFIKGKYDRRVMRAESVGFRPIEFERLDDDKNAKGFFAKFRFTKQELLEISTVPVPAHPRALRKALEPYGGKFHILMPEIPEVVTANGDAGTLGGDAALSAELFPVLLEKIARAEALLDEVMATLDSGDHSPEPDPEPAPESNARQGVNAAEAANAATFKEDQAERLLIALQAGKSEER